MSLSLSLSLVKRYYMGINMLFILYTCRRTEECGLNMALKQ